MKKLYAVLFLCVYGVASEAQITFLSTDMPAPGWVNAQHKDTSTGIHINFGNKGANQMYDFSMFQNNGSDSTFYLSPTTAQHAAVPNANLAVTGDHNTYLLGQNVSSYFAFDGLQTSVNGNTIINSYSQIDTYYKLPTVYGQSFRGTYGGTTTVPGSTVGISAANQVRITNTTLYTDTIDGWGTVKTPTGTYNCLRKKRIENSTTVIDYTLCSFCPWTNYQTIQSTTLSYAYLAKETHGTVITFTYDSINEPLTASWSTTPPVPTAKFGVTYGGNGSVAFHDSSSGRPLTYSWSFGDGSAPSASANPSHTYSQDTSFLVCLTVTNVSGTATWCDTVHITNAGQPVAPSATTDTASMTQPATLHLQVLANDSNYNAGDTVCITSVWGGPVGWTSVSGCRAVVFHPLDSFFTGIDTFYYRSCSLHHPGLCDTGMVVVTIRSGAPTASFTVQNVGCSGRTFISHSTLADSLFWHFSELNATGTPFDTMVVNGTVVAIPTNQPSFAGHNFMVCLDAKNRLGRSQMCDTVYFGCLGLDQIAGIDCRIYPNPASDRIHVELSPADVESVINSRSIDIYDMLGAKLKSEPVLGMSSLISVGDLSQGVYVVALTGPDQSKKILGKIQVIR